MYYSYQKREGTACLALSWGWRSNPWVCWYMICKILVQLVCGQVPAKQICASVSVMGSDMFPYFILVFSCCSLINRSACDEGSLLTRLISSFCHSGCTPTYSFCKLFRHALNISSCKSPYLAIYIIPGRIKLSG